jgi:hypothetical protein
MNLEDDRTEVVDELVDALDPAHVAREAERLDLALDELLARVVTEVKARLS